MKRLRRSELSTPGTNDRLIASAARSNADMVFIDLEDAVAPSAKDRGRENAIIKLNELDWGDKTRGVRVNDLESHHCHRDILELVEHAGRNLDVIIIPKAKSAAHVTWVDRLLTQAERRFGITDPIALEVLIEEVEGMVNAEEIALASPRLETLIFGMGDYAASQGADSRGIGGYEPGYPGDLWHYARNKVVIAARNAGLQMIDGPFGAFKDHDGYVREAQRARMLGAAGKWAIHPDQIALAHEVFTPKPDQIARARRLAKTYAEAEAAGEGSIAFENVMVDSATVRFYRNLVLDPADLLGM